MSYIPDKVNARQMVTEAIQSVFETMLSLPFSANGGDSLPKPAEVVCGSVGFAGEQITGCVYVHVPEVLARIITGAMLGMTPEEITGDSEVNDVVGEVCNMTAGGLKSHLCDIGLKCALTVPSIIRGASFEIKSMPDVQVEKMVFASESHPIKVEVHMKYSG